MYINAIDNYKRQKLQLNPNPTLYYMGTCNRHRKWSEIKKKLNSCKKCVHTIFSAAFKRGFRYVGKFVLRKNSVHIAAVWHIFADLNSQVTSVVLKKRQQPRIMQVRLGLNALFIQHTLYMCWSSFIHIQRFSAKFEVEFWSFHWSETRTFFIFTWTLSSLFL